MGWPGATCDSWIDSTFGRATIRNASSEGKHARTYSGESSGTYGRESMVRKGGLEPPWVSPPDPKSGASANSATFAMHSKVYHFETPRRPADGIREFYQTS